MTIEKFKQILGVTELPEAEKGNYNTIAGFVMQQLGRVPRAADRFCWGVMEFEVVDMDKNRVDKILVSVGTDTVEVPPKGSIRGEV